MNAYELARKFSEELARVLTAEQFDEMTTRNAAEKDKGICHSHDFCDANRVMIDAAGEHYEAASHQLINEAWDIAKNNEFSPSLIEAEERGVDERA